MAVDKAADSKESTTADSELRSANDSTGKDMTPPVDDDSNQGTEKSDGGRGQKARKSISVGERTSSRRTARYTCCVPKCTSDEKSVKPNGRPVLFFDMPEASDRRLRRLWVQAVPELQFAVTPSQKKVCERHFIDGRPTDDHPCPAMSLGDEMEDPKPKKRKSETASAATPNGNENTPNSAKKPRLPSGSTSQSPSPQSLDHVSHKVTKVATETPKTRARIASEASVSSSPNQKPTESEQPQPLPIGVTATKVVNQNQPRILRLPIKAFKSISGAGGGTLPKGIQILTHKAGSSPAHFQLPKGIVARPVTASTVAAVSSVAREEKESGGENAVVEKKTGNSANGAVNNHSSGAAVPMGPPKTGKKTLQSVLDGLKQQQLSAMEDDAPAFTQPAPPPPAVKNLTSEDLLMCGRCAADLPILRRLGRLESRLDSMISMVRTLCQRQSCAPFELKQRDPARSSLADNAMSQHSMMQSAIARKSLTPNITRRPVVDVKIAKNNGADGSAASSSISVHATNSNKVPVKRVIRIPVSLAKGQMNVGRDSAKKPREDVDAEDSSSSDVDDRLQIDESPAKATCVPADAKAYLTKAIARSLLLYPADAFTISEYRERGPVYARATSEEKLEEILRQLIDDRLLRRIDDHLTLADINAAYEKERSPSRLEAISKYGIALPTYINSFETRRT